MNEQEAITRAEAWYLQRYHAVAAGHITLDDQGQELRDTQVLCIDLMPAQGPEVVNVLVDLTGDEPVALLDEGMRCPRCVPLHANWSDALEREAALNGQELQRGDQ